MEVRVGLKSFLTIFLLILRIIKTESENGEKSVGDQIYIPLADEKTFTALNNFFHNKRSDSDDSWRGGDRYESFTTRSDSPMVSWENHRFYGEPNENADSPQSDTSGSQLAAWLKFGRRASRAGVIKGATKFLKKNLLGLLLAYKLKMFILTPLFLAGLMLILGSSGMAAFFFSIFALGSQIMQ